MRADGCKRSLCEWPNDKALNLSPVEAEYAGARVVKMWCEWSNYRAPLITRNYRVCSEHYNLCVKWMVESILYDIDSDDYYEREVKVPRDCIKSTRLLHSRRSS